MTLISSILGYSFFGFTARCFGLGIQKRPIMDAYHGHAYAVIAFGCLGAAAYHFEGRQIEMLAEKRAKLAEIRERETIQWEAKKAAAQGHAV